MDFIHEYYEAKRRMDYLEDRLNEILSDWHEIISKEISYNNPERVKSYNKLSAADKKKVVLGISFSYRPRYHYEAMEYVKFSRFRDDNDGITFGIKDHDGWGYIADKKSKKEMPLFYKKLLTEDVWKKAVKNGHTKLGFNDWKNNFKYDDENKNDNFNYYCDIQEVFTLMTLKIPKYISNEYIVAFDKRNFKKRVERDHFASSYL